MTAGVQASQLTKNRIGLWGWTRFAALDPRAAPAKAANVPNPEFLIEFANPIARIDWQAATGEPVAAKLRSNRRHASCLTENSRAMTRLLTFCWLSVEPAGFQPLFQPVDVVFTGMDVFFLQKCVK